MGKHEILRPKKWEISNFETRKNGTSRILRPEKMWNLEFLRPKKLDINKMEINQWKDFGYQKGRKGGLKRILDVVEASLRYDTKKSICGYITVT